jgi:hypothetical protein
MMVPRGREGPQRENHIYICILERIFWIETSGQFQSNLEQIILHEGEFKFIHMKVHKFSSKVG